MGRCVIECPPPVSRNATGSSSRGAKHARHRRKKAEEADLRTLLLAYDVPCPIPGDRVHATAVIRFPTRRGRDEGNYRDSLEKALGDALSPHPSKEELELGLEPLHKFLTDDQPAQFTFGAVTFDVTDYIAGTRRRAPAVAEVTLLWGDDFPVDRLEVLERAIAAHRDLRRAGSGRFVTPADLELWAHLEP